VSLLLTVQTPSGAHDITGAGQIASADAFGQPTLSLIVNAAGIASAEAIGQPTVIAVVSAQGIASAEAFGSPGVVAVVGLVGIQSAEAFGFPTVSVTTDHDITGAGGIQSEEAFDLPFISSLVETFSGGWEYARLGRRQLPEEVRKRREELGIFPKAAQIIEKVAERQAEHLGLDEIQRFEELARELELEGIEWQGKYLELLNLQRERLIDLEIGERLKSKMRQEEEAILILLMTL
jgi:hypothetical protein